MIQRILNALSPPRLPDAEEDRVARMYLAFLLAFAVATVLAILGEGLSGDIDSLRAAVAGGLVGVVAFGLLKAGRARLAAFLQLLTLLGMIAYVLLTSSGIHGTTILAYPLVLFFGAAFLRRWPYLALLVCTLLSAGTVILGETSGVFPNPFRAETGLNDLLFVGLLLTLCAVSAYLLAENLSRALSTARRNELLAVQASRALIEKAAALETSEGRWRSLVSGAPELIAELTLDGTAIFVNDAAGPEGPALVGQRLDAFLQPAQARIAAVAIDQVSQGGLPTSTELRINLPGQGERWYDARFGAVRQEGEIRSVMMLARDITAIRETQSALRQTEARLQAALGNLPFAFHICDLEGRFVLQNPTSSALWGDLRGHTPEELDLPEWTRTLWRDNHTRALRGEMVRSEIAYTHHGEARVYDCITAPVTEEGAARGVLGIDIDITVRKRAEDALRESEEQYRRLVEELEEVVFSIDGQGTVTYVSPASVRQSGYQPAEVIGRAMDEFIHADDLPRAMERFATLAQGDSSPMEVRMHARSGEVRWVLISGRPILEAGQVVGLRGLLTDITARKQAEEALLTLNAELEARVAARTRELAEAYEQLKGLDRMKTKFVTDVSHELRTPVTNLSLYLGLLDTGHPEKRAEYLSTLREQTDRLGRLIEDILGWARLDQQRERFVPAVVDLNAVVVPFFEAQQRRARLAGVDLRFEPEARTCPARGDRIQLAQAVGSLLSNALNYTREGSIRVITSRAGEWACLEVQDTGIGIDPEDLPHIFERFYRGARAVQESVPGTGLGLAIVKEIVELHGGQVELTSTPDEGTVVRLRIPAADKTLEAAET
jgi:PAS domain S-box-containing protein